MTQFFVGDTTKVIGGAARLLIAPDTVTPPTKLDDIISLTTLLPLTGWEDCGYTMDDIKFRRQAASVEWRSSQTGIFKRKFTDYTVGVNASFLQTTQEDRVRLRNGAVAAVDPEVGQHRTNLITPSSLPIVQLAILTRDEYGLFHGTYLPRCQWTGDASEETWSRQDAFAIPMGWTGYPEGSLTDPTTGETLIGAIFDQVPTGP